MPCTPVRLPNGAGAILCGPKPRARRCRFCPRNAPWLCDGPGPSGRTCDAPMCGVHRTAAGPDRDLCPDHKDLNSQLGLGL